MLKMVDVKNEKIEKSHVRSSYSSPNAEQRAHLKKNNTNNVESAIGMCLSSVYCVHSDFSILPFVMRVGYFSNETLRSESLEGV